MIDAKLGVPTASGVAVAKCRNPACGRPHIVMLNEMGQPMVECVIGDVGKFMEELAEFVPAADT